MAYKKNRLQHRAYKIVGFALTKYRLLLGGSLLKDPPIKANFQFLIFLEKKPDFFFVFLDLYADP